LFSCCNRSGRLADNLACQLQHRSTKRPLLQGISNQIKVRGNCKRERRRPGNRPMDMRHVSTNEINFVCDCLFQTGGELCSLVLRKTSPRVFLRTREQSSPPVWNKQSQTKLISFVETCLISMGLFPGRRRSRLQLPRTLI